MKLQEFRSKEILARHGIPTLPGETSPPKSGWSGRVTPMKLMKFAELGSRGALEMSRFHQFVGGKRGRGPGRVPPIVWP